MVKINNAFLFMHIIYTIYWIVPFFLAFLQKDSFETASGTIKIEPPLANGIVIQTVNIDNMD